MRVGAGSTVVAMPQLMQREGESGPSKCEAEHKREDALAEQVDQLWTAGGGAAERLPSMWRLEALAVASWRCDERVSVGLACCCGH